jgi:hypothetical protein
VPTFANLGEQERAEQRVKSLALNHNERTLPGVPPPGMLTPEGYQTPELQRARVSTAQAEVSAMDVIKGQRQNPYELRINKAARERLRIDQELERGDWENVVALYQHTGHAGALATQAGLTEPQVNHLLEYGINRLGLPPIKAHTIDQAKLQLDVAKKQREQAVGIYSEDVAIAVQERATQEAAAARDFLTQAINSGSIISGYVQAFMKSLANGETVLAIPKHVTLDHLESMSKVVDAHSRAMERAIKMVRLTQGEPTELIEHQVGALLALCTTRELEDAERTGRLPKRLTARISGSDPVKEQTSRVIDAHSEVVQGDPVATFLEQASNIHKAVPEDDTAPSWAKDIAPPEGESTAAVDDDGHSEQ